MTPEAWEIVLTFTGALFCAAMGVSYLLLWAIGE